MVLPNAFAKQGAKLAERFAGDSAEGESRTRATYPARQVTTGTLAIQRTDLRAERDDLRSRAGVLGQLSTNTFLAKGKESEPASRGVRKTTLLDAETGTAKAELEERGIRVTEVKTYDPSSIEQVRAFRGTPARIPKGTEVDLYEKDGKVMFYALRETTPAAVLDTGAARVELDELERRKKALTNLSEVNAELVRLETKRGEVANVAPLREEVEALGESKGAVQREVAVLKEELASLRAVRESLSSTDSLRAELTTIKQEMAALSTQRGEEERQLATLKLERQAATRDLERLSADLRTIATTRDELTRDITLIRPTNVVTGVTTPVDTHLRSIGIVSVGDLADTTPDKIVKSGTLTRAQASKLIANAQDLRK